MNEKTKLTLVLGGIILLVIGAVSVSFAFLSVSKKQDIANNFTSGCLNISIENESSAITLSNTYPITDLEGVGDLKNDNEMSRAIGIGENNTYSFTIKNTCSTSSNYQINLESLNQTANTLDTQYIKTSLSSDTMDNLIQKLDSNLVTKAYIENAYVSHNLYKGTIDGNSTKEFNLKLWIDYDTTKEQGANKTYTSKINVIANPDIEVTTEPEIKTLLTEDNKLEGTITGNVNTAKYCISNDNKCIPNISTTIIDNKISLNAIGKNITELVTTTLGNIEVNIGGKNIICISLNDKKTYCSNKFETAAEPDFSKAATTDEGVYKVEDGMYDGYSYYWRGAVANNYVKFANKCWRIIRINGDGSVRLIYDGTTCHANGTNTGESIAVTNQSFNFDYDRSEYVGYTYAIGNQRTLSGTVSNLKSQTDLWYNSNIGNNSMYSSKVADGKYCNDRNVASGYSWSSKPSVSFYYVANDRVGARNTSEISPTLSCNSGDTYTSKIGNISVDEVVMAGGRWGLSNSSYYLYNGRSYWTLSPSYWNGASSVVFHVYSGGSIGHSDVDSVIDVRPIINLKADTQFQVGGNGTLDNPYVVL